MKLSLLLAVAGWLVVSNPPRSAEIATPSAGAQLNIHLMLTDDQKWNTLGCIGEWINNADECAKFYADKARYQTTFDLPVFAPAASEEKSLVDLDNFCGVATLRLHRQSLGTVWVAPWRVDIFSAVKVGQNSPEITLVNPWNHRLVGDAKLPVEQRRTSLSLQTVNPDAPSLSASLLGPVKVQTIICAK
jgi:hypothetical protein